MRHRWAAAVAVLTAAALLGACSSGRRSIDDGTSDVVTTTSSPVQSDLEEAPLPRAAGDLVATLQGAVQAQDFCGLVGAMNAVQPDPADSAGTIDVYQQLATSVAAARTFVPRTLFTDWEVLVAGTAAGADAVAAADGDLADADVLGAFRSEAMQRANDAVERVQRSECPPESVSGALGGS